MNNDVELIPVKGVLPTVQTQSDNVIYIPQAHKNKPGIVKEGDGINIENGVVSLNKQTVEDMIDANKWVSYGFEQNLTEDEKGMARHNIGAGDNDFTGSYYDVTQKPHMNTNNTDSLKTGDEEINNTINLHKVSKTGSFDDLNDVPTKTIDFAESERQKSKNLFNSIYELGFYDISNGESVASSSYKRTATKMPIKPNTQYTFSTSVSNTAQVILFYDTSLNFISYEGMSDYSTYQFTTPLNAYYFTYYTQASADADIQVEEGSVATDYQPYNGAIVHEKGVERVVVVYDMNGGTPLDWGKTGGIYGGDVISGKDFRKYKKLIVYSYSSGNILTTIIPLTTLVTGTDSYIGCNAGLSNDMTDLQCIKCSVNSAKTAFEVDAMGYYGASGFVLRNNTNSYVVFKIEGVY